MNPPESFICRCHSSALHETCEIGFHFRESDHSKCMIIRIFLGFAAVLLVSCSWFGMKKSKDSENVEANQAPKLVGRIASIPADKKFALIQSYEAWKVETGSILTTRGSDGRTANLRVTGESMGQFAAADIQSGAVEIGDAVYSRHIPKPTAPPTAVTEAVETPHDPNTP